MKMAGIMSEDVERVVSETASNLVRINRVNGTFYINLPLVYPDGSFVTVRLDHVHSGIRVSDSGFAFRQVEDVSASRSFSRVASVASDNFDVEVRDRAIVVDATEDDLHRAIIDVGTASWTIADSICRKIYGEDDEELADDLKSKLIQIFGPVNVREETTIIGVSTNSWDVSAIVHLKDHDAVFQAVSPHANSIYKASTAFRDLSGLKNAPRLIAVVRDKSLLGPKSSLLAPAKIVESTQSAETFLKAAA